MIRTHTLPLLIVALFATYSCKTSPVSPTEDSSQFVTISDVIPDAILEIRYFATYNFVGKRIDGYEEPRPCSPGRLPKP